MAQEMT